MPYVSVTGVGPAASVTFLARVSGGFRQETPVNSRTPHWRPGFTRTGTVITWSRPGYLGNVHLARTRVSGGGGRGCSRFSHPRPLGARFPRTSPSAGALAEWVAVRVCEWVAVRVCDGRSEPKQP